MGQNTAIAWCDHTFNPWWGCSKVSPACDNCYAEAWAKRVGYPDLWSGQYRVFGEKHWLEPVKWDAAAAAAGIRERVFCASMADIFDKNAPESERERLWALIRTTPHLDWLLLTKRIGNASFMLGRSGMAGAYNIWLGATVIDQAEFERDVPKLLRTPARVRFLSVEPMLGPIEFGPMPGLSGLHWVICGGESGPRARPLNVDWAKRLRASSTDQGISFFMKQLSGYRAEGRLEQFPFELRVREFPTGSQHA